MTRSRSPSPQVIRVLLALAADPVEWRYGYDLATEVHLEIWLALSDPDPAGRPWFARNVLGTGAPRPTAPTPLSADPDGRST